MKGFAVLKSESEFHSAIGGGVMSVVISNKNGYYSIYVGGTESGGMSYTWLSEALKEGDAIEVRYVDIDTEEITEPEIVRDTNDKEAEDKMLLESYYILKKQLQDEGYDI